MKLSKVMQRRAESGSYKRFYTSVDMAIVKLDQSIMNSREKRGELQRKGNRYITVCGCGWEGCFIHGSYESKPKED